MTDYSEGGLVEKAAVQILEDLGYDHLDCYSEKIGDHPTLGRQHERQVVLRPRLKEALLRLNPSLGQTTIDLAVEELTLDRHSLSLVRANYNVYQLLRDGIKVAITDSQGEELTKTVQVIDFDDPSQNDYFLATQFWVKGEVYRKRPDGIGFINGLPLILFEFKASNVRLEKAYSENICACRDEIPQLFWYNAFIVLSNGTESRVGTLSADYENYYEWKRISEEDEGRVSMDTILQGTCEPGRFLDLVENFILYQGVDQNPIKILAQNHQYLGVNRAIQSFERREEKDGRLGVFWHTQGSGKSFSMIFFSRKILRKYPGDYTFVIVTDRRELDWQIYENFQSVGAVTGTDVHADSGDELRLLLTENRRHVFTLIQKFRTEKGETFPQLSDRSDIIIMADEAHRTQYDEFAKNMRLALPNACFLAFTGTPLMAEEEKTRQTFGQYVSVYDFKQSVEDGATVPLYYENRIPEVQLSNQDLNEDLERIIEEALLDDAQEEKLTREFAREYHLVTHNDRLEKIAGDIVRHFMSRGYRGKAMVVAIDKATAVKMYDKVKKHWENYKEELNKKRDRAKESQKREILDEKIAFMEETDLAVVVSSEQNERAKFKDLGLDIIPHRKRMKNEKLSDKFKDASDPFRIVFVCAMWMTGFDVPCLSTIYLDKPMRNHTLMQTIARANRVYGDKPSGLIVDYIGVFRNLQEALSMYTTEEEGETPVEPKEALVEDLRALLKELTAFFKGHVFDPANIIEETDEVERLNKIEEATNALLAREDYKTKFTDLTRESLKLYKAILPDPRAEEFKEKIKLYQFITQRLRSLEPEVDIGEVEKEIEALLDSSISVEDFKIKEKVGPQANRVDLSQIDFDNLREAFQKGKKNILNERLRSAIERTVEEMVLINKKRITFQERLEKIISDYNSGAIDPQTYFDQLCQLAQELREEEQRAERENLTEEELAVFDIVVIEGLNEEEREAVKKGVEELVETLVKEKLVLDWRKKQQVKAEVNLTIRDILDKALPRVYTPDMFEEKCGEVFEHVYETFGG